MIKAPGTPVNHSETLVKFLVLVVLSIGMMYLDYPNGRYRQRANDLISIISYPLTAIAAMPSTAAEWISNSLQSDDSIRQQLIKARDENLKLQGRLQKYEGLEAENSQLRQMFAASKHVAERSMVAKLLAVNPDPTTRTIVIDKGRKEGAFQGQPVIDAHGVIGQITEANLFDSRVTLITDSSHDIPVQVVRNGLRTILKGSSGNNELVAPFLTRAADIRKGDVLVTSGLGGRFPPNYPVAKVERVVADPNEAFLKITASPMAELDHGRLVLIIWPGKAKPKMDETP